MSKVISLREIIAALEAASDDCTSYLDPETAEIVVVTEEERALAEDTCWEEVPAWEREMMPKIRAALESDRFLELPDRFFRKPRLHVRIRTCYSMHARHTCSKTAARWM